VIDYILLLNNKAVSVYCKVETISLIKSTSFVEVAFSSVIKAGGTGLRSGYEKSIIQNTGANFINKQGSAIPAGQLTNYEPSPVDLIRPTGGITYGPYL
jgi:hypothetical protein